MRSLYTLLLACCLPFILEAGHSHKLNLKLYAKLQQPEYARSTVLRPLMVKGSPDVIKDLVARYQGVYRYSVGNISSIAIPYRNVLAFSDERAVEQIESYEIEGRSFMDSARVYNNVDSAHYGIAPLVQAYKGTGVLIGIIDGGIYFRHQDFRRLNGNTRILNIWDHANTSGSAPQPYNYGTEWDSTAINSGACSHVEPGSDQGHGTNVAGIAAGNGLSVANDTSLQGRYTGVAPDADMIVVSLDNNSTTFLQDVTDAIDYIFKKADQMGRPCVINTSVGTYYGSHDGNELTTKAIESLLDQKRGRVVVAAAGNGGAIKHHVSYALSPTDSLFTWFIYNSTTRKVYFDLWADTAEFKNANFAIGCDNTTPVFLGRTPYYNVINDFNPAQGSSVQIDDTLFQGSTILGTYSIAVSLINNLYHVEFLVTPTVTSYYWRLQTIGQGRFDLWASKSLIGTSSILSATLPVGFSSPNYRYGDSLKTIVSAWQCSDKVITVGNYSNRAGYIDMNNVYQDMTILAPPANETVGSLYYTSSIGPTRDGRMKPDITATGSTTTSTGDSTYIANLVGSGQSYKVSKGGKHTRNGGTSMSSPLVAGVAALYLQKRPNASYSEVKQVIEVTAKKDNFTTFNVPNIRYGWGKVNAYQALLYQVVYGCKDTSAFNYDPTANIDTGGCIARVYGCTDTGSINYNPLANTNNNTCVPKVYGCMDTGSINYNALANVSNGSCVPKVYGCTDTGSINYNASANVNNGSCVPKVYGCTDTGSINYNALANVSNGSCVPKVYGCMDTGSINYNASANVNNGSCVPKVYGITDTTCRSYNPQANVSSGVCIHVGIIALDAKADFEIIPNPFTTQTLIRIDDASTIQNGTLRIYDQLGRVADEVKITSGTKEFNYRNAKLTAGIYTFGLVSNDKLIAAKKVVIE